MAPPIFRGEYGRPRRPCLTEASHLETKPKRMPANGGGLNRSTQVADEASQAGAVSEAAGAFPLLRDRLREDDNTKAGFMLVFDEQMYGPDAANWWTALGGMERPEFEKQAAALVGPEWIFVALRDFAAGPRHRVAWNSNALLRPRSGPASMALPALSPVPAGVNRRDAGATNPSETRGIRPRRGHRRGPALCAASRCSDGVFLIAGVLSPKSRASPAKTRFPASMIAGVS
jgi:hypothetical protein